MSRTTVTFNGTNLTASYKVSGLEEALLPRTINQAEVPGRDGAVFTGVRLMPKTINLQISVVSRDIATRRTSARALAAMLAVSEPKELRFSIDGSELYYLAIPHSADAGTIWHNATVFNVAFECLDPVAYGEAHTYNIVGGTPTIGGSYPTCPMFDLTGMRGSTTVLSSGGIKIAETTTGKYIIVPVPTTGTHTVSIDCERRVAKVDGSVVCLTLDSDWLYFEPGQSPRFSFSYGAYNSAKYTYRDRWL